MSDNTPKSLGRDFFIVARGGKKPATKSRGPTQQEINAGKKYRDSIAKKYGKRYSQTPGNE